ncbi:DUF6879 family protein [Streptomyces sp. NBC_01429]|uniref:DUF6879 family protein n=1 Tax=Streptomyces sp. NBC_01429 TaxID=2903862 RepID=UPI003FCD67D8
MAWDLDAPYCLMVREQVALGKRFGRVRTVDDPHSTGQLQLLDNAKRNSAVGEEIHSLWRVHAERLRLPAEDFWIFDSRQVALLNFVDDDLADVELISEPVTVLRYTQIRDAVRHHAVPCAEFAAHLATTG